MCAPQALIAQPGEVKADPVPLEQVGAVESAEAVRLDARMAVLGVVTGDVVVEGGAGA
jgi:hypothetical protein